MVGQMALNRHFRDPKMLRRIFESFRRELIAQMVSQRINRTQKLGRKRALNLLARRRSIGYRKPTVTLSRTEMVRYEPGRLEPPPRPVPFAKQQLQFFVILSADG
jgi:hypothetical protein